MSLLVPLLEFNQGKKAYSEAFELVCRREADRPNAISQADHSLLDILIRCETEKAGQKRQTVVDNHYRLPQSRARRLLPVF
jgi:putative transposase